MFSMRRGREMSRRSLSTWSENLWQRILLGWAKAYIYITISVVLRIQRHYEGVLLGQWSHPREGGVCPNHVPEPTTSQASRLTHVNSIIDWVSPYPILQPISCALSSLLLPFSLFWSRCTSSAGFFLFSCITWALSITNHVLRHLIGAGAHRLGVTKMSMRGSRLLWQL